MVILILVKKWCYKEKNRRENPIHMKNADKKYFYPEIVQVSSNKMVIL